MTINLGSLIACFVVCLLCWYAVHMLVKPQPFRNVGFVLVVFVFAIWLMAALGIWSPFGGGIRLR